MNKIEKFKNIIRFMVSIFASREFGFIYCIIGTLAQCAHTYYLIDSVSSLDGIGKTFQAWALSIFISSSLLFFTAIAQGKNEYGDYDNDGDRKIHLAVNLFMWIEIIINLYYYAAHLLLTNGFFVAENAQWFNFIFAIIISCMIPVTIKLYAGIIQAKEWLEALQEKSPEISNSDNYNNLVTKQDLDDFKTQILDDVKIESNTIFEQGTQKFLSDFENKVSQLGIQKQKIEQPVVETIKPINIEKETTEKETTENNIPYDLNFSDI